MNVAVPLDALLLLIARYSCGNVSNDKASVNAVDALLEAVRRQSVRVDTCYVPIPGEQQIPFGD